MYLFAKNAQSHHPGASISHNYIISSVSSVNHSMLGSQAICITLSRQNNALDLRTYDVRIKELLPGKTSVKLGYDDVYEHREFHRKGNQRIDSVLMRLDSYL